MQRLMTLTFKATDVPGPPDFDAWCACFKVYRSLRIPLLCHAKWSHVLHWMHSSKPFACLLESTRNADICTAEDRARGEAYLRVRRELARAFQHGKLLHLLEYNPWDAVFAYMVHHADQWRDWGVRRPSSQFITRCLASLHLAPMVTLGTAHALPNLASASAQRTLPDGSRVGSSLFQG